MSTGCSRITVEAKRSVFNRPINSGLRTASVQGIVARLLLVCGCGFISSGCTLFEQPVERSTPTALGWLTNWNSQPLASTKPFDLEVIKPDAKQAKLVPESLLEVTVWDLYEPGRPHTFPVRVTAQRTIDIPLVGEHSIAGHGPADIETTLAEEFRRRDLLKAPRVLVRSLESGHVRVQVTGAVLRPGFVELSRGQASVYDAVVAAGGLKSLAGNQISVTFGSATPVSVAQVQTSRPIVRGQAPDVESDPFPERLPPRKSRVARRETNTPRITPASSVKSSDHGADDKISGQEFAKSVDDWSDSLEHPETNESHAQHANRIEELTVPTPAVRIASPATRAPQTAAATRTSIPEPAKTPTRDEKSRPQPSTGDRSRWFDVSLESDRQALQNLMLNEGDCVLVKSAAPPIRVAGSVNRPGDYALPADHVLDLWQALDLAGGIKSSGTPLNITLLRPPGEGHGPQRWQWQFESQETRPRDVPKVHPGDVIDIEPPAASKLRKAVGGLWNR